jgi:hypothetical protein
MTKTKPMPKLKVLHITTKLLKTFGACPEGIKAFKKSYPKGIKATVPPSRMDIEMMSSAGLDVRGFISIVPMKIDVKREDLINNIMAHLDDALFETGPDAALQNLLSAGRTQLRAMLKERQTVNTFNALMEWQHRSLKDKAKDTIKATKKAIKATLKGKR